MGLVGGFVTPRIGEVCRLSSVGFAGAAGSPSVCWDLGFPRSIPLCLGVVVAEKARI